MQQVTLAIRGLFLPGPIGAAFDQLQTWANNLNSALTTFITTGNWNPLLTALFGGTAIGSTLQTSIVPNISAGTGPGQSADLFAHLNNIVAQTGAIGADLVAAALASLQTQSNTLNSLAAQFQGQQTISVGNSQSGFSFAVPFNAYPDGPFSAAPFTTTKSGAGSGGLAISSGQAVWTPVNDGDVSEIGIFNDAGQSYTDTDYQILHASLAGYPGAGAKNYAVLRANADGTDYVYGVVYLSSSWQLNWEVGCYVAGVKTVFRSGTNAPPNLNFNFLAGVGTEPYRFQGYAGDQLVFDVTDTGHVSQLDASHRYWGFRSDTAGSGTVIPGPASYVGCADNQPPSLPGSGIRLYRTSTTSTPMAFANGVNTLINGNFFDAMSENSVDMTQFSGSVGSIDGVAVPTVRVANAGRYICGMRVEVSAVIVGFSAVTIAPAVKRYDSAGILQEVRIFPSVAMFINGAGGQYSASNFGGIEVIGCQAGDYLAACYNISGGSNGGSLSSLSFVGDSAGQHTYFEVTLANWSLS
jgi:hypothetical protein